MSNIALIEQDVYGSKDSFLSVLTDRSINFEREAGFAIQAISANDYSLKVAMGNRQSVIDAVTNIAAIGISLNPAKKQAYLVPRKNKICLDISYMGLMDLAMETGSIKWAQAALVHANDAFQLDGLDKPPIHKFNPFSNDRGDIIGVYVVVKTADGEYLTHTMDIAAVLAIRDRSESWKAGKDSPWKTDPGEMIKKTVVKQAYKYWPKTERLEKAIHYLNTDSGEGLPPIGANQGMPSVEVVKWINAVNVCETKSTLEAKWKEGGNALREAGDPAGYAKLKSAVVARLAELESRQEPTVTQQPIDGEVMA